LGTKPKKKRKQRQTARKEPSVGWFFTFMKNTQVPGPQNTTQQLLMTID